MRGKYLAKSYAVSEKFCTLWSFGRERDQLNGFIENAYYNGLGRYVCQLARVTLKFCKYTPSSKGARDFIEKDLVDYCRENPGVAFYLQPRRKKTPVFVFEYLNGGYHWHPAFGMSRKRIKLWLDFYTNRSGEPIKFFVKHNKTSWPSVQGPWNPFLNKPTETNIMTFPHEERGGHINLKLSASEQLIRMQKEGTLNNILFSEVSSEDIDPTEKK